MLFYETFYAKEADTFSADELYSGWNSMNAYLKTYKLMAAHTPFSAQLRI